MPFIIKKLHSDTEQRAFLFLIRELGLSQREAQRYIAIGRLFKDGTAVTKTSMLVKGSLDYICFEPQSRGLLPIFQTDEFALFDKPSGVMVHPQNRHTPYSLIDEIKSHFGMDANITHRIDQETSGLVLSSKNKRSERILKMMFENREMNKRYIAMVHGKVSRETKISVPLLRQKDDSAIVRMVVKVHASGKSSETTVRPLRYYPELDMTLIEAKPMTGRQHQIRVHLFHVKHPIVGDPIYAQKEEDVIRFLDREISEEERIEKSGAKRLLLHASQLDFIYGGNHYSIHSQTDFLEEAFLSMNK
ncbi:MAG: RNA pseudouridine synthase [Epsilonproteobacteria bacterium]|nr:MAG: RNA pseudouridine synthase [Campylobacterota bacterium]